MGRSVNSGRREGKSHVELFVATKKSSKIAKQTPLQDNFDHAIHTLSMDDEELKNAHPVNNVTNDSSSFAEQFGRQ